MPKISGSEETLARDYWLNVLSGNLEKCGLRYDRHQINVEDNAYQEMGIVKRAFDDELNKQLLKLAGESDTKLFMILTAGLIALLHRYTGSEDLIVGAPIYKQEEEGSYINTILPIRSRCETEITFKELLLRVREAVINGYKNQNYPLDVLLYELGIPSSKNDFPLFEIAVLLESIHDKKYIRHTNPAVYFSFRQAGGSVEMVLEYRSALYDKQTMERTGSHYTYLLQQVLSDVDLRLSQIDIMSEEEKEQVLIAFNRPGSEVSITAGETLQGYFEKQVNLFPDREAVSDIGKARRGLSYRELDEISDRLAWKLREKGVKNNTIVGLMVGPSIELIVSILAILKAGGAYLGLDIETPARRVRTLLADSGATLFVSQKQYLDKVNVNREVVDLEREELYPPPGKAAGHRKISNINKSSDLAYIIYTSGSTGQPKGVLIEHGNILNYALWRLKEYNQAEEDVCLQLLSIAFDGFCANLYPTLLSGGKIVLPSENKLKDIDYFEKIIVDEKVTTFSLTPSLYKAILEKIKEGGLKNVKFVVIGGERAFKSSIEKSIKKIPQIKLINEYGPTENSVTTTAMIGMTPDNTAVVGKPIANNCIFILGINNEPLPVGVPGELYAAGTGLARGYLNNPELTAEKFIYRILSANTNTRLYRTGDTACWLPDGNIELIGRRDSQVKIRGYRVELGEIENRLLGHNKIKEAVVDTLEVRGGKEGDAAARVPCAYIVTDGSEPDIPGIREYLSLELPDYMIPTYFIRLGEIPLTPIGKIDRNALRKTAEKITKEKEYVKPGTGIEKKLAGLWEKILEIERIGITDNFFNSGGDSIKILSLIHAINKDFNTSFKIEDLYEHETIEKFALLLEQRQTQPGIDESKPVVREMEDLKKKFFDKIEKSGGKID